MRCLYCGKELALFKRLTGGAEFCSDAHRQKYQEEYNQLALSRLLQASPVSDAAGKAAVHGGKQENLGRDHIVSTPVLDPGRLDLDGLGSTTTNGSHASYQEASFKEEPYEVEIEATSQEDQSEAEEEIPADPAGFLVEIPLPLTSIVADFVVRNSSLEWEGRPEFPHNGFSATAEPAPAFAGAMPLNRSVTYQDSQATTLTSAPLEAREPARPYFGGKADFPPMHITGLEATTKRLELSFTSNPPEDPPVFWLLPAREFGPGGTELGDLARLAFATLGWDELVEQENAAPSVAAPLAPRPQAGAPAPLAPPEPIRTEPKIAKPELKQQQPLRAEPIKVPPVKPEPVKVQPTKVESVKVEPVKAEPDPVPMIVTRPLPITLHGHAPGRGKPVQVFPNAIARVAGVHIPRSSALPLRPTMVFGPVPAAKEQTKEQPPAAPEPVKQAAPATPIVRKEIPKVASKPDIRTVVKAATPTKRVQPEKKEPEKVVPSIEARVKEEPKHEPTVEPVTKVEPPVKTEVVAKEVKPAEKPKTVKKPDEPREEPKTEVKEAAPAPVAEPKSKKDAVLAAPIPAPLAAAYTDLDLGLPSLGMQNSQGFFGKLPVFAKAAAGAALVVTIVVAGLYYSKQSSSTTARGPVVVAAGTVLSSGDAGWLTDWSPDPVVGSKRLRRISVMRASQSLSDYRMEFEGQIDTKAFGWVFRASNPKNFYVEKVEVVKPGLEPKIQLVRFAVIDGVEQPHQDVPLNLKVRPDTVYKIRFEAIGDRFTTWILDQKVDEWTDARVPSGGAGLYSEAGESLSLKGSVNIIPLVVRR